MAEQFWEPTCPNKKKTAIVCLSHSCQLPPFQCQNYNCACNAAHKRCKTMQWGSVQDYLRDWRKNIGKEGDEFMSRIDKIFRNIKERIERQQKLFEDYCKESFLGRDYSKLMYYLQKREQKQITPELISSALRNLTEPTQIRSFHPFTLSQMHGIDQLSDKLLASINNLYRSKQKPLEQFDKFRRCSSAMLQRQKSESKLVKEPERKEPKVAADIVDLKLDLSYPKQINSRIVSEASGLSRLLQRKVKKYHLAFRASEEQFRIQSFYHKINATYQHLADIAMKQNRKLDCGSLIIVKTEFNKIVGGFTPLKWQAPSTSAQDSEEDEVNPENSSSGKTGSKYRADTSAKTTFFSLEMMEKYELRKPDEAIYCGRKSIGFGKGDLKLLDSAHRIRKSYCKFPTSYNLSARPYLPWSKSGMELSGGRYSVMFKVLEWQAFVLEF